MFIRLFFLFAALVAVPVTSAEVLQVPARGRFFVAKGWRLDAWRLVPRGRRVRIELTAAKNLCLDGGRCRVVRTLTLPRAVTRDGAVLRFEDGAGRVHILGTLDPEDPSRVRLARGIDVRWEAAGTFLLVDTDETHPALD